LSSLWSSCQFRKQFLYLVLKCINIDFADHNANIFPFYRKDFILLIYSQNIKLLRTLAYQPIGIKPLFRSQSVLALLFFLAVSHSFIGGDFKISIQFDDVMLFFKHAIFRLNRG